MRSLAMKLKVYASVVVIVAVLLLMRGGRFSVREERASGPAETVGLEVASRSENGPAAVHRRMPLGLIGPRPWSDQAATPRPTNIHTRLVLSNAVADRVIVPGPLDHILGTQQYEVIAKKDFEENAPSEPTLGKAKDILEADGVPTERIYSAVRAVWEMRSEQIGWRFKEVENQKRSDRDLADLEVDPRYDSEERAFIRRAFNEEARIMDAMLKADAAWTIERTKATLQHLVGGVSEATFERFYSLEPRSHASTLRGE